MHKIYVTEYRSPCGPLTIGCCDDHLCICDWTGGVRHTNACNRIMQTRQAIIEQGFTDCSRNIINQLEEYFAGERREFDVLLYFTGTPFQKRIWTALLEIPYGDTKSYGELARHLGCPTSVRAVANAIGANLISIFVPCHRIVGSDGSLTGYAGGFQAKKFLLNLEASETSLL